MRVLLFTDTIGDLNGVSRFLQDMAENALKNKDSLQIIASTYKYCPEAENIRNFKPRFRIRMPYYKELDLSFPPAKEIEKFVRNDPPDLIHVSTPGPVGLLGRKIAKKMHIPVLGTYHTDFPAYIRDNTGSDLLKRLTDRWMQRFYRPFIHIFSRSAEYGKVMQEEIGIDAQKISYIRPGTNLQRFSPHHRHEQLWEGHGCAQESIKVLYVGRMTKEKNVGFLLDVWSELKKRAPGLACELIMIGEGFYAKRAALMKNIGVYYIGRQIGKTLSQCYASADLFLFPSVTDTLGQVVMESSASGLALIVSNVGGPQSLVNPQKASGFVVDTGDMEAWVQKLEHLIRTTKERREMGESGLHFMQNFPIQNSYEDFWGVHRKCFEAFDKR
jgi:glycosyltransferase involved in cell wall biosynthesis